MATENQVRALEKWLNGQLSKDEAICEMPFDACSDALTRLSEASQAYKDKKLERGGVLKVKKEIVNELRRERWIDDPTQGTLVQEEVKPQEEPEPDIYIDDNEYEDLNDTDFEVEGEGTPEKDPVREYVELISRITETVEEDERIPPHEKGYAVNNVFQAISRDLRTELIAGLSEKRGGGDETPLSDF